MTKIAAFESSVEDMDLDSMISALMGEDEIVEPTITDEMIAAAVSGAEAVELMMESATVDGGVEGAAPTGTEPDVTCKKAAKAPKAPKAAKVTAEGEPVERAPRVVYTDKIDRLKGKLGTGLTEYSVLTLADAGVAEADLAAKMSETMEIIKQMNSKEQSWAVKFIEYMAGKKASMSEVTRKVFEVLEKDGFITTGNEGNVFKTLLAKPYSAGAARAMGGNNIGMLRDLKVITQDGKGKYVANPESLLLMKARSMLFTPTPVAA